MENGSLKTQICVNSLNSENGNGKLQGKTNFSSIAVNTTMTEQLITPPARVWDRIEKILDEQDNRRRNANELIASSFTSSSSFLKRRKVYLASVAGLTIVGGLLWMIR